MLKGIRRESLEGKGKECKRKKIKGILAGRREIFMWRELIGKGERMPKEKNKGKIAEV